MRFKAASRVRGLSDAAFREAFGTGEQCRNTSARWLHPSGLRPSRALLPDTPAVVSVQSLQEADLAHLRHDPPFDQAGADDLVRCDPSGRDGEERDIFGGTGPPVGHRVGDGLDDEAENHGGDGPERVGKPPSG